MKLHSSQLKLIKFLKGIDDLDGISYWDIARETDLKNAQNVIHHLGQLEKLGYLRRDPSNSTKFEILKDPIEDVVYLNLFGFANCGNESEFFSETNSKEKIAISTKLFGISNPENYFVVKAKGDSMSPDIFENDLVIFESKNDIDSGNIALVLDNNEPKIKQVIKGQKEIILHSLNKSHKDKIIKRGNDFIILGVAKNVIHSL